jgi:replicative DNA helicase
MRLSAPIYRLKRQAKLLSRNTGIPLNEALNKTAEDEGFQSWSLLAARYAADSPTARILAKLSPGDLVLLGARQGHGKTLMALEIIVEAIKAGGQGAFYTLDDNESDVMKRLHSLGATPEMLGDAFILDTSDAINADYIIEQLRDAPRGTVLAIDYLQILDQRRENPEINGQVAALRAFAQRAGVIIILISQIDRKFELSAEALPNLTDVRMPNPLDLALFNKTCFLNDGELKFEAVA